MSYAGVAANIVGGEMQGWAAALARQEMFKEYQRELARQRGYRNQALGVFGAGAQKAGVETAREQLGAGQQNREQQYQRIGSVPLSLPGQSQISTGNPERNVAYAQMAGTNRARLGSYSDWALEQALQNAETQRQLGQITNFAGGTANLMPYRMYDAQHSQDQLAMIGAAIASLGGGAANFAQYNQFPQRGQAYGVQGGWGYNPQPMVDPNTGNALNLAMFA